MTIDQFTYMYRQYTCHCYSVRYAITLSQISVTTFSANLTGNHFNFSELVNKPITYRLNFQVLDFLSALDPTPMG